ncbi:MerR family transcriptional regulator [Kribbella sp. NPDC049174]|uniref:MerR family transcriptional regulator n=1 Tax=Kribbella sp. NPDC049174 TaxID=3364112 RepID=UPI003714D0DD
MRMTELSERSGVPIPTIRYYLREGLLPSGRFTSPNQATYDDSHVRRLTLIRAMVEVGEMPIAAVGRLFRHLETKDGDEFATLGLVQYSLVRELSPSDQSDANARVQDLLDRLGWRVRDDNPARSVLATTIETLERLGYDDVLGLLDRYAAAAHELAEAEVDLMLAREGLDNRAGAVVVTGILGDAMLGALRRLAQEDATARKLRPAKTARTKSSPRRKPAK